MKPTSAASITSQLHSWLEQLKFRRDSRIYQAMTVSEIVAAVFKHYPGANYDDSRLQGDHQWRVYCVQYNETDYDFVCRLLEESGIYFLLQP